MKKESLFLRYCQISLVAFILVVSLCTTAYAETSKLSIDKYVFQPGEEIRVHFIASPSFPANAWVGIIPSNIRHGSEPVNDQHDIAYQYLNKRTRGTLIFKAPAAPGSYDFRMNDLDYMGKEVCFVTFRVEKGVQKGYRDSHASAKLSLDKYSFRPGEKIRVKFTAPSNLPDNAWIGIVPSHISHGSERVNDQHDISYQYIKGRTNGVMIFTAPSKPGAYDFRMNSNDNNGKELAYVKFKVVN